LLLLLWIVWTISWCCVRWGWSICIRWSGRVTISGRGGCRSSSIQLLLLILKMFLMRLNEGGFGLDQGILNWACDLSRKHWPRIHRAGNRFLPGFQHLVHLPPYTVIDQSICLHEGLVELSTKEQSVWCADILDDGIEDIESR
jgi:hypothetical protein